MSDRWYYEAASPTGKWCPVMIEGSCPEIEGNGDRRRVKLLGSTGPRVRTKTPVKINVGHHHLTLDQLRECYSPDGKFRNY